MYQYRPSSQGPPVDKDQEIEDDVELKERALLVALGLVYYMRLDTKYRQKFVKRMDQLTASCSVQFKEAFTDGVCKCTNRAYVYLCKCMYLLHTLVTVITTTKLHFIECILQMDFYINNLSLPVGIAKTEALKENLFATIICTVTNTPLIIVGAPGSSKTLSFNLTISNLKGRESKK